MPFWVANTRTRLSKVHTRSFPAEPSQAAAATRPARGDGRAPPPALRRLWTRRRGDRRWGGRAWSCSAEGSPARRPPPWRRSARWTGPAEEERHVTVIGEGNALHCREERARDLLGSTRCRWGLGTESTPPLGRRGGWWGCPSSGSTDSCCASAAGPPAGTAWF